jgi:hypothetical protein
MCLVPSSPRRGSAASPSGGRPQGPGPRSWSPPWRSWAWSVYLRATRVSEFAFGTLPRWPFTTYVLLTIGGLGLLGVGLLASGYPGWLDWLTLAVDILFLGIYLRFEDIPPFVFYLLLTLVGAVMLPLA